MSLYSGIIKDQAAVIDRQHDLIAQYHALAHELTDVLAQHTDVSEYERRLNELKEGE